MSMPPARGQDQDSGSDEVIFAFNEQVRREVSLEALLMSINEDPGKKIFRVHGAEIPSYAVLHDGLGPDGDKQVLAHVDGHYLARSRRWTVIADMPLAASWLKKPVAAGCNVGSVLVPSMSTFKVASEDAAVDAQCICGASQCATYLDGKKQPLGSIELQMEELSRRQDANSLGMGKIIR